MVKAFFLLAIMDWGSASSLAEKLQAFANCSQLEYLVEAPVSAKPLYEPGVWCTKSGACHEIAETDTVESCPKGQRFLWVRSFKTLQAKSEEISVLACEDSGKVIVTPTAESDFHIEYQEGSNCLDLVLTVQGETTRVGKFLYWRYPDQEDISSW